MLHSIRLPRKKIALRVFAAVVLSWLGASTAAALVSQSINVEYNPEPDRSGMAIVDADSISVSSSTDIDRALFASVGEPGGQAGVSGSVGRFGNFGVQGQATTRGAVLATVNIDSNEFVNLTGRPQRIEANFIVDGGELVLAFAPGASLSLNLRLDASGSVGADRFGAFVEISDSQAGGSTTFMTAGDDIGAFLESNNRVEIPFSFQSVDLGVLGPGDRLQLRYTMQIFGRVPNFAEILTFRFSDPLDVSGSGAFPGEMDITMTPIPEPGAAFLIGLGLAGLARLHPGAGSKASTTATHTGARR